VVYTAPLSFHSDVRADLAAIKAADPDAHARVVALFQQLKADPRITEKLLDHGFGANGSEEISVNKWMDRWKKGLDLWRLKSWDMESLGLRYRAIYLYLRGEARFVVMAIVKREDFDYDDPQHPIRKRIDASLLRSYGLS